jgi:hypothetical protein
MPSSISSSSRILAAAVAILVIYCLAVEVVRPAVTLFPDQDAYNRARAERYLVGHPADTILVGSSLSVRMPDDWMPENWLNLSFGGKGATTGLALISASPVLPKRVIIETNTLALPRDDAFLGQLQGPIPLPVRRLVRGLREEYRPINLLLSLSARFRTGGALVPRGDRPLPEACKGLIDGAATDSVQQEVVRDRLAMAVQAQAAPDAAAQVRATSEVIEGLAARGVDIVLLEWPVHPDLAAAPASVALRKIVSDAFPGRSGISLDPLRFQTEDGQHLAPFSARRAICELIGAPGQTGRR